MAEKTLIAWTDHTFNIVWGCVKVSPGCKHCYAEALATRRGGNYWGPKTSRRILSENHWKQPMAWNRHAEKAGVVRRVFCGSMCDVFEAHEQTNAQRQRLWDIIRQTPWVDWQLLTKRPENIWQFLPADWGDGWDNVWLGTSIEHMDYAWRLQELMSIPAAVRFVSYEPALGPLDELDIDGLDWVIFGGESGPKYREADLDWARAMRDKCVALKIPYFFKQSAARYTERGTELDGETIKQYPENPRRSASFDLPGHILATRR